MTPPRFLALAALVCALFAGICWLVARRAAPESAEAQVERARKSIQAALDGERSKGTAMAKRAAEAMAALPETAGFTENRPAFEALAALEEPGWGLAIIREGAVRVWGGVLPAGVAGWALDGESGVWEGAAWSYLWFQKSVGSARAIAVRALRPRIPLRPELRRSAFPAEELAHAAGVSLGWEDGKHDLGGGVKATLTAPGEAKRQAEAGRVPLLWARGAAALAMLFVAALGAVFYLRSPANALTRHGVLAAALWGPRFIALGLGIPGDLSPGPLFDPSWYGTLRFLELARTAGEVALTSLVGAAHFSIVSARGPGNVPRWLALVSPLGFGLVAWVWSEHLISVVRDASTRVDLLDLGSTLPHGPAAALWISVAAGGLSCLLMGRLATIGCGEAMFKDAGDRRAAWGRLAAAGIGAIAAWIAFRSIAGLIAAAWLPLLAPRRAILPMAAVGAIMAATGAAGVTLLRESDHAMRVAIADEADRVTAWQGDLYADFAKEAAVALAALPAGKAPTERDLLEVWSHSAAAKEGLGLGLAWSDGTGWWTFSVGMEDWDPKVAADSPHLKPVMLPQGVLFDHTATAPLAGRTGQALATVRARADEQPVSPVREVPSPDRFTALRDGEGKPWLPSRLVTDSSAIAAGGDWHRLNVAREPHEVLFRTQPSTSGETRTWAFGRRLRSTGEDAVRMLRALFMFAVCGVVFGLGLAGLARAAGTIRRGWSGLLEVRLTAALVAVSALPLFGLAFFARSVAVEPLDVARAQLREEAAGIALQGVYAAKGGVWSTADDVTLANTEVLVARDLFLYRNGQLQALGQPSLRSLDLVPGYVPGPALREMALYGGRSWTGVAGLEGPGVVTSWYPSVRSSRGNRMTLAVPDPPGPPSAEPGRAATLALGGCTLVALLLWPVSALVARRISGPVAALTGAAGRVEAGDLTARVTVPAEGEVADLVAAFNRMTEGLEKGRDALARAERERAWREMARQVAHEIKNPLTPLKLSLQNLRAAWRNQDPGFGDQLEESVDLTVAQIDSLARIATDFSQFAGHPKRVVERLDVNALLRESFDLFRATAPKVMFIEDFDTVPAVSGDRTELSRAFTNLVKNAVQAMPAGGMLTATTRADGDFVEVRVRDTGQGISEEVKSRMFEPYFSTKTEGTGLGLGIVRRTVEDMGGKIEFESEVGKGTTMILRLPTKTEKA